jgi:uncharacterized OB-fold protein
MMVVEEEGMPADEGPTVPAGAGEARPDRRMCEACAAEGRSTKAGAADMGEVRTATHAAADMHSAEAASVHSAEAASVHPAHAAATEMATTAEAAAAVTATSAATSGEHW